MIRPVKAEAEPAGPVDTRPGGSLAEARSAGVEVQSAAAAVKPSEELDRLLSALRRNPELEQERLRRHLEQSQAAAAARHWHAAVSEARLLLDTLFLGIGHAAQQSVLRAAGKVPMHTPGPRVCRRYLLLARLLATNDLELVGHVMALASTWHGAVDGVWCDVTRRIIWTTARYLVLRYEAWKRMAASAGA